MSPELFAPLAAHLHPHRVSMPLRVGYRPATVTPPWASMACDILDMVAEERQVVLVGVSGGATLALALCIELVGHAGAHPLVHVVVHEPLVGALVPGLHEAVTARANELNRDPSDGAPERFVERLVGAEVWATVPAEIREFATAHSAAVRVEAPRFLTFAPSAGQLSAIDVPITVTVGAQSVPARHDAAALVAAAVGGAAVVIPNASHLATWQQPASFAAVVQGLWHRGVG